MGSSYLKNHIGFSLTDEQCNDIPHPTTELVAHVTLKTVQAGALLGTCLTGPLAGVARAATRNMQGIVSTASRHGRVGVVIGLGLGPLMTYMKVRGLTEPEIVDRDFRLRHNRGQVIVDRASIVGGLVGAGANVARAGCPITGALFGISAGILGSAFYNNAINKAK